MSVLTRSTRFQRRSRSPRRSGQWDPSYLGLRALYDNRASSAAGMADRSGNGLADATVGAGSNSPLWLPYTTPSAYLPGALGNHISAPDASALDVVGDLEIVARVALSDWTPSALTQIAIKGSTASVATLGYSLLVQTDGTLLFQASDGAAFIIDVPSTVPVGAADGAFAWIKVTVDLSDGSNAVVTYYKAADQETEPSSWTTLETKTRAIITALNNSAGALLVGSDGGTRHLTGKVAALKIRNGIGGAVVADFDAALCTQTGHTDQYGNVWTVNRASTGRKSVVQSPAASSARGVWSYGADDYTDLPTTAVPAMALANAAEVLVVVRQWTTATSFGNYLSTRAAGAGQAGLAITSDGTSSTSLYGTISDGVATPTINATVAGAGVRNVIGLRRNTTTGLLHVNGFSGTSVSLAAVGATAGTTPRIGVRAGGSGYQDFEFEAFLSADRLLTSAELAQVVAFYGGGQ
jgi:hypothetical protein